METVKRAWPFIAALALLGCARGRPLNIDEGRRFRAGEATQSDVRMRLGDPNVKATNINAPGKEMWKYEWGRKGDIGGFEGRGLIFLFEKEKLVGVLALGMYCEGTLPVEWRPGPLPLSLEQGVEWWRWE